jgi:hypothetical protein
MLRRGGGLPLERMEHRASLEIEELREATKEFDREMVVAKSRPLRPAERRAWEKARRKPGRPRRGAGVKVISVSVERDLLARSDELARTLGVSRASLIERGLKAVLRTAGGPRGASS